MDRHTPITMRKAPATLTMGAMMIATVIAESNRRTQMKRQFPPTFEKGTNETSGWILRGRAESYGNEMPEDVVSRKPGFPYLGEGNPVSSVCGLHPDDRRELFDRRR
jgi:hypothetical protein